MQGDHPLPQFPHLVGYLDLHMRKTLRVAGLLTLMIFFQSKKCTAVQILLYNIHDLISLI